MYRYACRNAPRGALVPTACLLGALVALLPSGARAELPYYLGNMSPLVQLYGIPPPEPGRIAPRGGWRLAAAWGLANYASISRGDREALILDGETMRLDVALRRGIGNAFEVGLDVPFVSHNHGVLDATIEGYHDLTGLPNGDRDELPTDALRYEYADDRGASLGFSGAGTGLGDIRLSAGWQILAPPDGDAHLAARASVKLATGDARDLTGSGAEDAALALTYNRSGFENAAPLSVFAGGGLAWLGNGDVLAQRQEETAWFVDTGAAWKLLWFDLQAQVRVQSAVFDSSIREMGDTSYQIAFGGTFRAGPRGRIQLGFIEDIWPGTAPDFGIHLAWVWTGGGRGANGRPTTTALRTPKHAR